MQRWWTRHWQNNDADIRRTVLVFALVGIVSFTIGVWLDVRGKWNSLPFITNLVSSLTGASFGFIFALLILQSVTRRQAEAQSRREAERLYRRGLAELELAARAVFADRSGSETTSAIMANLETIDQNLPSFKKLIKLSKAPPPDAQFLIQRHPALVDGLRKNAVEIIQRSRKVDRKRESWVDLQAQWRFFSDFVRGRVFGADIPWLSADDFYSLQTAFGSPVDSPWNLVRNTAFMVNQYARDVTDAASGDMDDNQFEQAFKATVVDLRSHLSACRTRIRDFTAALDVLDKSRPD